MKCKLFLYCMLLACVKTATAQTSAAGGSAATGTGSSVQSMSKTFIIYMNDTNVIRKSNAPPYAIISSKPQVQAILNNYNVYAIEKAFPASRLLTMRSYYRIRANSFNLMNDLLAYNPGLFPTGFKEPKAKLMYEPAEFFNGSGCDTFLKYIKADKAWNYTQGKPDVHIGIADTYFDLNNPDLAGRIGKVWINDLPANDRAHGTQVAGFAACNTDDNYTAAVGWNCRLDVATGGHGNYQYLLDMTKDNVPCKIVNGSWVWEDYICDWNPNASAITTYQGYFNEIYENGATAVFAAGNSAGGTPDCGSLTGTNPYVFEEADVRAYNFPASLDHVLSISSVGFGQHRTTVNAAGATERLNWSDIHRLDAQNPASAMHHNDRVDLLAPAFFMPALHFDPNNPNVHTTASVAGISYSAPIVSGTVGLMQSVVNNQCLSPYQVEYILKTTANTDVFNRPENASYTGMLGAGILDAEAAVEAVAPDPITGEDFCNDPATQTFVVKSVDVNTICAPGYSSNGVLPKLKVELEHGTPPFTYEWIPQFGIPNSGTLDSYNTATPTVTSVFPNQGKLRCAYWLKVTDNSPVAPQIAHAEVLIYFKTSGYDIAMRDGGMDMYSEPYRAGIQDPRERIWWNGPDMWNRRTADGLTEHQNPEYYTTDSNYLYTRIHNVGCQASPGSAMLRLYWTLASTGEDWDHDWKDANFPGYNNLPAGRQITTNGPMFIPAMQPGENVVLRHAWRSPNPADYGSNLTELNACVLARIEENTVYPYGMTSPEMLNTAVGENVKNNNNIITRNLSFVNLAPGNEVPENLVIIANPIGSATAFNLQLINDRDIRRQMSGDFSSIGFVRIKLGQQLYDRWMRNGGRGNYAANDGKAYTVDFDGTGTLTLEGIVLEAHEHIPVTLQFIQREGAVTTGMDYTFHLQQVMENPDPEMPDQDPVTGGVDFVVHTQKPVQPISKKGKVPEALQQHCKVYPNPASDRLYIESAAAIKTVTLCDMSGRVMYSITDGSREISLQNLKAGIYILSVTDATNGIERFKIVKQ